MPSNQTRYLTVEDLRGLHAAAMLQTEQQPAALAAPDKLEAALARPQQHAWYEGADLIRQAAVLGASVAQAHAFIDGNKRAAAAALDVFLKRNGYRITASELELAQQIERLVTHPDSLDAATDRLEQWLRAQTCKVPPLV